MIHDLQKILQFLDACAAEYPKFMAAVLASGQGLEYIGLMAEKNHPIAITIHERAVRLGLIDQPTSGGNT